MEIKNFEPKNKNDLLALAIAELKSSPNKNAFFYLMSQRLRAVKGKAYKNFDGNLPFGNYQELEVNGSRDSRRIVVDMDNFNIYATRDHYQTMLCAGRPFWTE